MDRIRARPVNEGGLDAIRASLRVRNTDAEAGNIVGSLKKPAGAF